MYPRPPRLSTAALSPAVVAPPSVAARDPGPPGTMRDVERPIGRLRSLVLTSLAHFTNDGTVFFVPVIAAIVASHRSVPPIVITVLFLVFYGSSTVLSLFVGRLSDRLGRPASLMGVGLGILSAGLLGFYLALAETSGDALVVALLVAAFLTGAGSSFYHPLGASVLQATFRDRSMGTAMGINGAMGSLGRALYPSLYFVAAAVIAGYGSIVLFALVGFAAGLAIWFGVQVPASARTARHATPPGAMAGPDAAPATSAAPAMGTPAVGDKPATGTVQTMGTPSAAVNTPAPGTTPAAGTPAMGTSASERPPVARAGAAPATRSSNTLTRGILILTAVAFLRSSATQGIASWIPTYLATQRGLGVSGNLGLAVTIMYAAAIIGQPTFGLLVDRFDKRAMLALSSAGGAVTTIGYLAMGSGWIGEVWLFAFGFFVFSGFPLLLSMVGDYVPRGETSLANALVWGVGSTAGGAVGPLVAGALTGGDYGRLGFAFVVLAGAALVSAAATALVPRAARPARMRAFA